MKSYFAKPERSTPNDLLIEIDKVHNSPVISGMLESVGGLLAILNEHRQIVALNNSFLEVLGVENPEEALGLRPGEAVHCIHACREEGGCGTSKYCASCGAVIAVITAQSTDEPVERTCAISTNYKGKAADLVFSVKAFPMHINKKQFILLFLQDVSEQQQKAALEHTFFHDVNNMLQVLVGASELLVEKDSTCLSQTIYQATKRLQGEITIQHCLLKTNSFNYQPHYTQLTTSEIIDDLKLFFDNHPLSKETKVDFSKCPEPPQTLTTDQSLLWRILHNMILNGLEASDRGKKVYLWFDCSDTEITFKVWNHQVIDDEVVLRVFERNFTTKAAKGRGIGTFSMKFFGEQILGGKVEFTTDRADGTTFMFTTSRRPQ